MQAPAAIFSVLLSEYLPKDIEADKPMPLACIQTASTPQWPSLVPGHGFTAVKGFTGALPNGKKTSILAV
jgi:hypothetical protein